MDDDQDADGRTRDRTRDALLVARLRGGDERAFGEIYDAWYDRVHDLARRIVRDDGRAADVAQDTFLNAWRRIDTLADPASLGGWLLRIARNRALNVVEKEGRSITVDDESMHRIEAGGPTVNAPDGFRVADLAHLGDPARVVEHDEVAALLWEAADALGERDRTVLDLQLRHGLTPAEIGEVVGVNRNAANQLVHRVKGRLESAVQARVLWRGEIPSCEALRAALAAAGVDTFDSRAVTITNNHASGCEECGERRHLRLQPTALFGALPIVVAPFALKQQAAAALAAEGVPMHGSSAASGVPAVGEGPGPGAGPAADPTVAGTVNSSAVGADDADRSAAGHRRTAVAVAVVLALFVLAAGIGLALGGDDDEPEEVRSGPTSEANEEPTSTPSTSDRADTTTTDDGATTTTGPTTTSSTTTTTPTSPANAPPGDSDPPLVVPPTGPGTSPPGPTPTTAAPAAPTTTTTAAPTATASISVSPSTYSGATVYNTFTPGIPTLRWSSTGGATVSVTGPGFSASAPSTTSGVVICPGFPSGGWTACPPNPGLHRYQIRVYDAGGNVLVSRSAFLTIT